LGLFKTALTYDAKVGNETTRAAILISATTSKDGEFQDVMVETMKKNPEMLIDSNVLPMLIEKGEFTRGVELLRTLKKCGPCPVPEAHTFLMEMCGVGGDVLSLLGELGTWVEPNCYLIDALLQKTFRSKRIDVVEGFLALASELKFHPMWAMDELDDLKEEWQKVLSICPDVTMGSTMHFDTIVEAALKEGDVKAAVGTWLIGKCSDETTCSLLALCNTTTSAIWPAAQKMRATIVDWSTPVGEMTLFCFARAGHDGVVSIYESMMKSKVPMTTYKVNELLKALGEAKAPSLCVRIIDGMVGDVGPKPNSLSFCHCMAACSAAKQLGDVFLTLELAKEAKAVSPRSYALAVKACIACNDIQTACEILKESPSQRSSIDAESLQVLLASVPAENGVLSTMGLCLVQRACEEDIPVDAEILLQAVGTHLRLQSWHSASRVLRHIPASEFDHRSTGLNLLLRTQLEAAEFEKAAESAEIFYRLGYPLDSAGYFHAIASYGNLQEWVSVLRLAEQARNDGVKGTAEMFTIVFEACMKEGHCQLALFYYDELVKRKTALGEEAYFYLMSLCLDTKKMSWCVRKLYWRMKDSKVVVSPRCQELYRLACKW